METGSFSVEEQGGTELKSDSAFSLLSMKTEECGHKGQNVSYFRRDIETGSPQESPEVRETR